MSQPTSSTRVPLPQLADVSGDQRAAFEHIMATRGVDFMPNVFSGMGNSPGALATVAAVGEHIRYRTDFDAQLRELCILTVAQETRCPYEWAHHLEVADRLGIDETLIAKIGLPEAEALPAPVGPALRYTRLVANNEPVDDATVEALQEAFGIEGFVDLTILAGYYGLLARFINSARIPLEVEARPFSRPA